jgi:hypothetical protein
LFLKENLIGLKVKNLKEHKEIKAPEILFQNDSSPLVPKKPISLCN